MPSFIGFAVHHIITVLAAPGSDYEEIVGEVILFPEGADSVTHTINITQDTLCEIVAEGEERFLSVIQSTSGPGTVIVNQHLATVIIEDSSEPECGEYKYDCLLVFRILGFLLITILSHSPLRTNHCWL